jgi:thiol peroxidase
MAKTALKGNTVNTSGELPSIGSSAPLFTLVSNSLAPLSLESYEGKRVILNIFPSVDTGTCATSVRTFNKKSSELENTVVICISKDLPFAQKRFCGAEGIENVEMASEFRNSKFSNDYGVLLTDGPLEGLMARSIVVLDEEHKVIHTELVSEITEEPNYEAAISVL